MWFTENPWPPMVICGVLAALLWIVWLNNARPRYLVGIGLLALAATGIFFLEQALVSPKERMQQTLRDLVKAFEAKRIEQVIDYLSPSMRDKYSALIRLGAKEVEVQGGLSVPTPHVEFQSENTRALARMHVNGTILFRGGGPYEVASLWELTWRLEAGEWKIIEIRRLNPVNHEEMGVFQ